jgi:hypothetical protein
MSAHRLQQASEADPQRGKPITLQSRPFALDTTAYLRAAAGAPAWSRRLVRIERLRAEMLEQLRIAQRELSPPGGAGPATRASGRQAVLQALDLAALNELIDKHNAFYPIEAGLGMEWPSGRYIVPPGMQFPLPRVTLDALIRELARGPADADDISDARTEHAESAT